MTLPDAKAKPLPQGQSDALALTIKSDGTLFLQEEVITMADTGTEAAGHRQYGI